MRSKYLVRDLANLNFELIKYNLTESDVIFTKEGVNRSIKRALEENVNFNFVEVNDVDDLSKVKECLSELLEIDKKQSLNLILDISLMPRKLVAEIIALITLSCVKSIITLSIVYGLAEYKAPIKDRITNFNVMPVSRFYTGWSISPGLPVMTIVGLGYEKDKALGAIEYVESSKTILYLPESMESKYKQDVKTENENIIHSVPPENILDYDVHRPVDTIYSIDSMINSNKSEYKVVLFPFGPKFFFASALVASIPHPETSLWYVSGEEKDNNTSQDRKVKKWLGFKFILSGKDRPS